MTARTLVRMREGIRRIGFPEVIAVSLALSLSLPLLPDSVRRYLRGEGVQAARLPAQTVTDRTWRNRLCAIEEVVRDVKSQGTGGNGSGWIKNMGFDEVAAIANGQRDSTIQNACGQQGRQ